jgi:hypothetical protein
MAVKTFTAGNVLTASDTNTYLGNAGLVYVTSANVGANPITTFSVSGCFTSTYDNYKIIWTGGLSTGTEAASLNLLPTSVTGWNTSYSMNVSYCVYGGSVSNLQTIGGTKWGFAGEMSTANKTNMNFDLFAPNLAQSTGLTGFYIGGGGAGASAGIHTIASAFSGFTISTSSTFTGGTITVYGYRKA